jgi:hypothetical protein
MDPTDHNIRIRYFESTKDLRDAQYLIGRSRLRFVGSGRVLNAGLWIGLPFVVVDKDK